MSGRLLANIAYRHLRDPLRHTPKRDGEGCLDGCPVHELEAALNEPVLASERTQAKAEEERMQALARGDFTHLEGAGDGAGQAAD